MRLLHIIFFFAFHFVIGQNYDVKLFDYKNGFPSNKIFDLIEDSNKIIWLGTDKGLVRFDGLNFVKIELKKNANKAIRKLKIHQKQLYIFYQNGGVNKLDLIHFNDQLIYKSDVNDICFNKDSMWVLHPKGFLELKTPHQNKIYNLNFDKTIVPNYGCLAFFQHRVFISLPKKGIYSFNAQKSILKKHNRIGSGYYENFVLNANQLYFIRTKLPQKFNVKKQNFESIPLSKYFKGFNNDYLTENKNAYFISDYTSFYKKNGSNVQKLYETKDVELIKVVKQKNRFYFATNKGLLVLSFIDNSVLNFDTDKVNTQNYVRIRRKIIVSNDSVLLFGFPYIHLLKQNKLTNITNVIASNYDAIKYRNGYLACNDGVGLVYYTNQFKKKNKIKIESYNYNDEGDFTTVYFDAKSGQILVGNKKYIYFLDANFNVKHKTLIPFHNYSVKKISNYKSNSYLIATDGGLFVLNTNMESTIVKALRGLVIGDLVVDAKNALIYVGHENGLSIFDYKSLKCIKQVKFYELVNPKVASINLDANNRIWCSTYSGVICYDYKRDKTITLDYKDGLLNSEYNFKAAATIDSNTLIIGGLDGYDIINTKAFNTQDKIIQGKFTGMNLFSRTDTLYFSNTEKIAYKGEDYFCRIYFSPESNTEISKCKFKYAINDGQWISLFDKSSIDLIGLEPNTYTLKVEGADQFGNKINFPSLTIKVTKPFIKTDAFIYTIILILVLLISFITYNSFQTKKEKLKIYDQIAMDLHDEVGNILTHLMLLVKSKTDLNSIKKKIIDQLMVANYGLRVYINTTTKESVSLELFNDELIEELSKILSYHNIEFCTSGKHDANRIIDTTLVRDLKLVIFEIINNAIKHSNAHTVNYEIVATKSTINIVINDDGEGFDALATYKGKGLKNIHKRIAANNGRVEILADANGTRYTITFTN